MSKIFERETANNLICRYQVSNIHTIDEFVQWFSMLTSVQGIMIKRIQIIDSSERSSEGAGSMELDLEMAKCCLAHYIKCQHADSIFISIIYRSVKMTLGVDLYDWVFSVAGNKNTNIEVNAFAEVIGLH